MLYGKSSVTGSREVHDTIMADVPLQNKYLFG